MATKQQILVSMVAHKIETQARRGLDNETVASYLELIQDAQEKKEKPFDDHPLDLFHDGKKYYVGDGWHRLFAFKASTEELLPAIVHQGGKRDALLFAAGANARHGLNRTDDDKRRAVGILLADKEWAGWSDRAIADHCHVSAHLVAKIRLENAGGEGSGARGAHLNGAAEPPQRKGADGKSYPATKPKKGDTKKKADDPAAETHGINIHRLAEPYQNAVFALNKIKRDMHEICDNAAIRGHLASKATRIYAALDEAKESIHAAEPVQVCDKCQGEGCQHCQRTGFWSRLLKATFNKGK